MSRSFGNANRRSSLAPVCNDKRCQKLWPTESCIWETWAVLEWNSRTQSSKFPRKTQERWQMVMRGWLNDLENHRKDSKCNSESPGKVFQQHLKLPRNWRRKFSFEISREIFEKLATLKVKNWPRSQQNLDNQSIQKVQTGTISYQLSLLFKLDPGNFYLPYVELEFNYPCNFQGKLVIGREVSAEIGQFSTRFLSRIFTDILDL